MGLNVSSECQYRDHLESKAKLVSKQLGVIIRARQYFTPKHRMTPYRAQVWPHMEYCSHLWAGAPQYQFNPFDRIQCRARIVGDDQRSVKGFTFWLCVETCPRCAFSIALIMGNVLKNCLTCYLPPNFLTAQYVTNTPRNCGMGNLRQCFQVDMTWVPLNVRVYLHFKDWHHTYSSSGATRGRGWR